MIDVEELALQRSRYPELSDVDFRFMLQQIDGRQRTTHKLPTLTALQDWWFPRRLACEQCSSELTANYKTQVIRRHPLLQSLPNDEIVGTDLTGGYGIDSYFFSRTFGQVHYVEKDAELCRIAHHNFSQYAPNIHIHNTDAGTYIANAEPCHFVYIDPARRNKYGNKVFCLENCEPNLNTILQSIRTKTHLFICKLSPMLDISAAVRALQNAVPNNAFALDVHIVAVGNEVKELLLITAEQPTQPRVVAVNIQPDDALLQHPHVLSIVQHTATADIPYAPHIQTFLYEPNAAILKAGMYNEVAQHFHIAKLAPNTHLYTSNTLIHDFPGRVWRILRPYLRHDEITQCNVITRNYPLTPEQLKKKLRLQDGGDWYLIGTRIGSKATLLLGVRIG